MRSSSPKPLAILLLVLLASATALAQGTRPMSPGDAPSNSTAAGNLMIYLRTADGQEIPDTAVPLIRLTSVRGGMPMPNPPTRVGGGWLISGLTIGNDYEVQITANGYLPAGQVASVPDFAGATGTVTIFLRAGDPDLVYQRPRGQFVLAPKAERDIEQALSDLQAGRFAWARKETEKAMKLAPANPYVQYVMGLVFLHSGQITEAKPFLEKAVSIDPNDAAAMSALGKVCYRLGDYPGAIDTLTKAAQLDATSWNVEWLLGAAYLAQNNYTAARDHADRALKVGKEKADQVEFLLGAALAGLGEREQAAEALVKFADRCPQDPNATKARDWAKMLLSPPAKPQ